MALEEKNPLKLSKESVRKRDSGNNEKEDAGRKIWNVEEESYKQTKTNKIDVDEDLDAKYYIKINWLTD
jgi:hypothetical protein